MSVASTLTEKAFAERRRRDWDELDALLREASAKKLKKLEREDVARMPSLYRNVCSDLAAAQAARYSAPLVDYLRDLTAGAHTLFYGPHAKGEAEGAAPSRALLTAFPRAVRANGRAMLLSAALFFFPLLLGAALSYRDPTFAFRVAPEGMLKPLAEAYAKGFDEGRGAGQDAAMFGFYVMNNVGIALRCFAVGISFGLGSAFYLVQNGLSIGAIFGYVASKGAGMNLLTFVVGHSSLELGAIILSGGAGLAMGWSIVAPGPLTRLASLQKKAKEIFVIVGGAAVMLVMAACVEGFWSASSLPRVAKMAFGLALFLGVSCYIGFAGRASVAPGAPSAAASKEAKR